MDPVKTIGQKLTGDDAKRDCIHIAIFPAIAAEQVYRGQEVALAYGTKDQVKPAESVYGIKTLGIVDPFLGLRSNPSECYQNHFIKPGERCWVFLFPGSITGLRHDWALPEIDQPQVPKSESEKWLREFADKWNFDYDEMIDRAISSSGNYVVARGISLHSADDLDPGDEDIFWRCIENLTGKTISDEQRRDFGWSCTC